MKKLIAVLTVILLLLLALCGWLHLQQAQQFPSHPTDDSPGTSGEPEDGRYTVTFRVEGQADIAQQVASGGFPSAPQLQLDGLRLGGWRDEQGNTVDPSAVAVTADTVYHAVVYPVLQTHTVYLFADEKGYLRPDDDLSADDLALALRALAEDNAESYFPKLPEGTQAVSGETLKQVLSCFFEEERLSQLSQGSVSRSAFAVIMNNLLDWSDAEQLSVEGKVPVDLTADRPDVFQLLEASVAHTPTKNGVMWTEVELPTAFEPGLVNVDGWLYYVQEDHYFLRSGSVGTLNFGADGRYTSGDSELDAIVAGILKQMMEEEPDADRMTLLRRCFDYCHQNFKYRRTWDGHPAYGSTGWEAARAKNMFQTGKGNCYCFASIFWALSRGLGYETRAISGTCLSDEQPHSWCIIELDGDDYFFDPEWQWAYHNRGVYDKDMFKIPMSKISFWGYKWKE